MAESRRARLRTLTVVWIGLLVVCLARIDSAHGDTRITAQQWTLSVAGSFNAISGATVDSVKGVAGLDSLVQAESPLPFDPAWIRRTGRLGLLIAMGVIALATLISEDLTCIGTGIMVAHGSIGFWPGTLACFIGIVMGDCIFFALGRLLGRPVLERPPLSWIVRAKMLDGAVAWFRTRGPVLVFVTRLLPGFRVPVYVAAGVLHTGAWTFVGWFFLAASIWTPAVVWLSARSGQQMVALLHRADGVTWPPLLLGGLAVFLLVRFGLPLFTARGRVVMAARWERVRRWISR